MTTRVYGSPRIYREIEHQGVACSENQSSDSKLAETRLAGQATSDWRTSRTSPRGHLGGGHRIDDLERQGVF
ncbi:MAG: hypothetical protein SWK90_10885 [Chloroflexota bacterium]|nr:hypothetical protein [Chloroflexota bacterium]